MSEELTMTEREARIFAKEVYLRDLEAEMKEVDDYLSVHREGLPLGVITMILEGMYQRRGMMVMLKHEISELQPS